jgi:Transcriptional Coactivator p15 (PC4)
MPFREIPKSTREVIRVSPSTYEGHELIDIRVYARNSETGEFVATRKGIALNVDTVPELIDLLVWALGQPCANDTFTPERKLGPADADRLANNTWKILSEHGTAVHWDSAERMVLSKVKGFSKWDLHHVLATRRDLFERVEGACYRARKHRTVSSNSSRR